MKDVAFVFALGLFISIQTAASFKFSSTRRPVIHSHGFSGLRSNSLQMVSTPHGGKVYPIFNYALIFVSFILFFVQLYRQFIYSQSLVGQYYGGGQQSEKRIDRVLRY